MTQDIKTKKKKFAFIRIKHPELGTTAEMLPPAHIMIYFFKKIPKINTEIPQKFNYNFSNRQTKKNTGKTSFLAKVEI